MAGGTDAASRGASHQIEDEPVASRTRSASSSSLAPFDTLDVQGRCHELLRRISQTTGTAGTIPWKWDILELLEESRDRLNDARRANASKDAGGWQEISEVLDREHTLCTLPVALRKQCEELLARREMWIEDFDDQLRAILARGKELRERLLFEDVDRAGWFGAASVSALEVQRLIERHMDMHQRAQKLARQLKLMSRALQQQGAVSSRRRAFQARTMGEKLQSSLVCLAAVAVAPVPGSSEMWLATTTMMWLDKDQAWQHVVYEHPRDADSETILNQFQCRSAKARESLASWLAMPQEMQRNCVLVHNASVRRVIVKTHLVNYIDGYGESSADWTTALDNHPLGSVMKRALTLNAEKVNAEDTLVIGAQRLAVVPLPPKPDQNWGWRGTFSYGDTKVGECRLREGGVFSFICVDNGLKVGDRGECAGQEDGDWGLEEDTDVCARAASKPQRSDSQPWITLEKAGADEAAAAAGAEAPGATAAAGGDDEHQGAGDAAEAASGPQDGKPAEDGNSEEAKGGKAEEAEEAKNTSVEVVNRTDEPVQVKVFEFGKSGHASRLFRSPVAEGTISPGLGRVFSLKADPDPEETIFDVEIRIGKKRAKCEVVGEQVIFVDGFLAD